MMMRGNFDLPLDGGWCSGYCSQLKLGAIHILVKNGYLNRAIWMSKPGHAFGLLSEVIIAPLLCSADSWYGR